MAPASSIAHPERATAERVVREFPWLLGRAIGRTGRAGRRLENWLQLVRFCVVGSVGYLVNLAVYATALGAGLDYRAAAVCAFLVAVTHNYLLNRRWTFAHRRGHIALQAARYVAVSTAVLGGNLALLAGLVTVGLDEVPAQAVAILLVTPVNFLGNRLWTFGRPADAS